MAGMAGVVGVGVGGKFMLFTIEVTMQVYAKAWDYERFRRSYREAKTRKQNRRYPEVF